MPGGDLQKRSTQLAGAWALLGAPSGERSGWVVLRSVGRSAGRLILRYSKTCLSRLDCRLTGDLSSEVTLSTGERVTPTKKQFVAS